MAGEVGERVVAEGVETVEDEEGGMAEVVAQYGHASLLVWEAATTPLTDVVITLKPGELALVH